MTNFLRSIHRALARLRIIPPPRHLGTDPVGLRGERAARHFLESAGYRILATNAITPEGEADIVAERDDRGTFAIVEVKSRVRRQDGSLFNPPERSVTARKAARLSAIARHLAIANGWERVCVEVVAVEFDARDAVDPADVRHHRA